MKYTTLNDEIILFPNKRGWERIIELFAEYYYCSIEEAKRVITLKRSPKGFKIQMWQFIATYGSMIYHGNNYFENTNVGLTEIKNDENQ